MSSTMAAAASTAAVASSRRHDKQASYSKKLRIKQFSFRRIKVSSLERPCNNKNRIAGPDGFFVVEDTPDVETRTCTDTATIISSSGSCRSLIPIQVDGGKVYNDHDRTQLSPPSPEACREQEKQMSSCGCVIM